MDFCIGSDPITRAMGTCTPVSLLTDTGPDIVTVVRRTRNSVTFPENWLFPFELDCTGGGDGGGGESRDGRGARVSSNSGSGSFVWRLVAGMEAPFLKGS